MHLLCPASYRQLCRTEKGNKKKKTKLGPSPPPLFLTNFPPWDRKCLDLHEEVLKGEEGEEKEYYTYNSDRPKRDDLIRDEQRVSAMKHDLLRFDSAHVLGEQSIKHMEQPAVVIHSSST